MRAWRLVCLGLAACDGSADKAESGLPQLEETGSPAETNAAESGETGETGETGGGSESAETGCDPVSWYTDVDGDGWGEASAEGCEAPAEAAEQGGDCDDADPAVNPGAEEICRDGVDNDCDGAAEGCAWSGELAATDGSGSWVGLGQDKFGEALAAAGDMDGDGFDEVIASKQGHSGLEGADGVPGWGWVLFGGPSPESAMDSEDAGQFYESDQYMTDVAGAGDVDGDGYTDLIAASSAESRRYSMQGVTYLVWGESSRMSDRAAPLDELGDLSFTRNKDYTYTGNALASGEVDGDGLSDLLIGMPANLDPTVALVFGADVEDYAELSDAPTLSGEKYSSLGGYNSTLAVGDLDGDGLGELLMGSPFWPDWTKPTGRTYIVQGGADAMSGGIVGDDEADGTIDGTGSGSTYTTMGYAVDVAGDVDGDGYQDALIGDPYDRSTGSLLGALCLFAGGVSALYGEHDTSDATWTMIGDSTTATGWYLSGIDDLDGDGHADLAGRASSGVLIFYGSADLVGEAAESDADVTLTGGSVDGFGVAMTGHADVNGDGVSDFVVAAPYAGGAGTVYLFLGGGF